MSSNQDLSEGNIVMGINTPLEGRLYGEGQLAEKRLRIYGIIFILVLFFIVIAIVYSYSTQDVIPENTPSVVDEILYFVDG